MLPSLIKSSTAKIVSDDRGKLIAFDNLEEFTVKRFYLVECIKDMWRGNHYHKIATQLITLTEGELIVNVTGVEYDTTFVMVVGDIYLQTPNYKFKFKSTSVTSKLLVLCDSHHDKSDYYT